MTDFLMPLAVLLHNCLVIYNYTSLTAGQQIWLSGFDLLHICIYRLPSYHQNNKDYLLESHYYQTILYFYMYFLMNYWQIYNLKNNYLPFEDEVPVSQADFKSQETLIKELQEKVIEQETMCKNILQKYKHCKEEKEHQIQILHQMIHVIAFLCLNLLLILLLSLFIPLHNSNKVLIQMYDAVIFTHMYT